MSQAPTVTPKFEFNEKIATAFLEAKSGAGGLHDFLGFETVDVGPGTMQARFEVRPELMTPIGNMHGGVLAAFCDHLMGTVCYPVMKKGQWAATTEFKLNLSRPVSQGSVDGYATIISMGRTQAVVRIDVHNEDRLAASAQGTVTIMDARQ
jgi:1,4-dihydroxy-2-naphthoyl-CoA hydrolase